MTTRKHEPILTPERKMLQIKEQFPQIDFVIDETKKMALRGECGEELQKQFEASIETNGVLPAGLAGLIMVKLLASSEHIVRKFGLYTRERMRQFANVQSLIRGEDITVYDAWKSCKQIYRFERSLAQEIVDQQISDDLPTAVFDRLPYPLVYIDCPISLLTRVGVEQSEGVGFFVYIDPYYPAQINAGGQALYRPHLVCVPLLPDLRTGAAQIQLDLPTITDAVNDLVKAELRYDFLAQMSGCVANANLLVPPNKQVMQHVVAQNLNLVMYICSENADVVTSYIPPKPTNNPKKKTRRSDATVHEVGYRIARAIKTYRADSSESGCTGTSVAPHIRRAHWHHYWRGPKDGDRELILRWLPPIPVNIDSGEMIPTIHNKR